MTFGFYPVDPVNPVKPLAKIQEEMEDVPSTLSTLLSRKILERIMKYCSRPTLLGRLPVSRGNGVPRLQQGEKTDTSFFNML